jgi:hypothetical protein
MKAVSITGKISDDGKMFVSDKDSKSWIISKHPKHWPLSYLPHFYALESAPLFSSQANWIGPGRTACVAVFKLMVQLQSA